ncbi:MAG: hypothetical protein AAF367_03310 [Pseudomonadota bacterium]
MSKIIALVACAAFLQACASSSENVDAAYVSPTGYQGLECDALVAERSTLKTKVVEVSAAQDDKAGGDAAAVAVAAIVFLPAALFLAAGEDKSGELSRLKGEFDAVTTVATQKDCISAEQLAAEQAEAEEAAAKIEARQAERRNAVSNSSDG